MRWSMFELRQLWSNYLVQDIFWILSLFLQLDQQTFRRDQNLQMDRRDRISITEHVACKIEQPINDRYESLKSPLCTAQQA